MSTSAMEETNSEAAITEYSSRANWCELHLNPPSHSPAQNEGQEDKLAQLYSSDSLSQSDCFKCGETVPLKGLPRPESTSGNFQWCHGFVNTEMRDPVFQKKKDDGDLMLSGTKLQSPMYEEAYDYLKKDDHCWGLDSSAVTTDTQAHCDNVEPHSISQDSYSDMAFNWTIAPPMPAMAFQTALISCDLSLSESMRQSSPTGQCRSKGKGEAGTAVWPFCGRDPKAQSQLDDHVGVYQPSSLESLTDKDPCEAHTNTATHRVPDCDWSLNSQFPDLLYFDGHPKKSSMTFQPYHLPVATGNVLVKRQKGQEFIPDGSSGEGAPCGTGRRKRRLDGCSRNVSRQEKYQTRKPTSMEVPNTKFKDQISTLQQIVSPCRKMDTASVLLDVIGYIKCLHEQIKVLSCPYLNIGAIQKFPSWEGLEKVEKARTCQDLRSRGLYIVPLSITQRDDKNDRHTYLKH